MGAVIKAAVGAAVVLAAAMVMGQAASARTYEHARQVGKRCSTCHDSKAPQVANLNAVGRYFLEHRTLDGYKPGPAPGTAKPPVGAGITKKPAQNSAEVDPPGLAVFDRMCAVCHGPGGTGTALAMPLTGERAHATTVAAAVAVITNGIPDTPMGPFKTVLSEREIRDVAEYVMTLKVAKRGR